MPPLPPLVLFSPVMAMCALFSVILLVYLVSPVLMGPSVYILPYPISLFLPYPFFPTRARVYNLLCWVKTDCSWSRHCAWWYVHPKTDHVTLSPAQNIPESLAMVTIYFCDKLSLGHFSTVLLWPKLDGLFVHLNKWTICQSVSHPPLFLPS